MTTPYAGIDTFPATIPLPQDLVDKRSASVFNGCFEPLMDAVRWLKNRTGGYQLISRYAAAVTGTAQLMTTTANSYGTGDAAMFGATQIAVEPGDLIIVHLNAHVQSSVTGAVQLATRITGGATPEGAPSALSGAEAQFAEAPGSGQPFCVGGQKSAGTDGYLQVYVEAKSGSAGTSFSVYESYSCMVEIWRAN